MKNQAVVLAGGEARRLPNKALLPTRVGGTLLVNAVESAVAMINGNFSDVSVVIPDESPLEWFLRRELPSVRRMKQLSPTGVVDAINIGMSCDARPALIVCCDNVFPEDEVADQTGHFVGDRPVCQVRQVDDEILRSELDRYEDGHYWNRAQSKSRYCIAGWVWLPRALDASYAQLWDMLDHERAVPMHCEPDGWWDLGTAYAYGKYWRSR